MMSLFNIVRLPWSVLPSVPRQLDPSSTLSKKGDTARLTASSPLLTCWSPYRNIYLLRGQAHAQKQLWDDAHDDFNAGRAAFGKVYDVAGIPRMEMLETLDGDVSNALLR